MPLDWQRLAGQVTVKDIMTPRSELQCFTAGENREEALSKARANHYDVVPVEKDGRIISLLLAKESQECSLDRSWLISGDTDIPALLDVFVSSKRPALFVLERQEIGGLVTPADLNRIPARVFFYRLLAELEWGLAELVRERFDGDLEKAVSLLGPTRQKRVRCLSDKLRKSNAEITVLEATDLGDLMTIVRKTEELYDSLGYPSGSQFKKALGAIPKHFRNPTMHTVRNLFSSESGGIDKIQKYVGQIRDILKRLEKSSED